jgi:hypothetical protein
LYRLPIFRLLCRFYYPFLHPPDPFSQRLQAAQVLFKGLLFQYLLKLQPVHPVEVFPGPIPVVLVP